MPQADASAFAEESGQEPTIVAHDATMDAPASLSFVEEPIQQSNKFYTEDDLARVRAQEKEKLYPQIDSLKEELNILKKSREEEIARVAAEEAARREQMEAEQRAKLEEELSAKELLELRQKEWEQKLIDERNEREKAFALLEREKSFAELQNYRNQRVEEARESIIPELVDMISGNTPEEIDASITALTERSARIIDSVAQASQAARREMVGTRPTLPSTGPLDTETGSRQFTAADISGMSMNEYAKYRQQLLSPTAQGRTSGLFG
jgi:hypothetical protein